jgi:hypothetical protein
VAEDFTLAEADMLRAGKYLPSRDALEEAAYLISRGVRPLALMGHCPAEPAVMLLRVRTVLATATERFDAIPFILVEADRPQSASFGYAAHRWVIDLLEWVYSRGVPKARKHQVLGLLLGYSPSAIARHEESDGLWEFRLPGEDEDGGHG